MAALTPQVLYFLFDSVLFHTCSLFSEHCSRFPASGFSAMYCTYYVIDARTNKVMTVMVGNKRQVLGVMFSHLL